MVFFWFLFLFFTSSSVLGRVAVRNEDVPDHIIPLNKPPENSTIAEHEDSNVIHINIPSIIPKNKTRKIANDNFGDGNKVDIGPALLLTAMVKDGRVKDARIACKVDPTHFLGFKSYSGFLTVNETYNSNLFFWYFPAVNKSVSDTPWIIWMQGGPGASSLIGLFDEIGPFTYINGGLELNPFTWLHNHSLLFIDNPVGTGFSFTDHKDGYSTHINTYSSHLYSALHQFLQIFPELKTAPLYLAGESYAGKYVPALAMEIHRRKMKGRLDVNLQGLILGNAFVDPDMIAHLPWPFYYFGLLVKEQVETVKPLVDAFHEAIAENDSVKAKRKWNQLITILLFITHQKHGYNFLKDEVPVGRFAPYLGRAEIKRALHVGDIRFSAVNFTVNTYLEPDFLSSTKPFMETLLEHYRVLAYCGQLDQMLPCMFTSENYRKWQWNGTDEFLQATRYPYIYENKLSGYHKTGGGLTEVVMRGAGHMVPLDAAGPAQAMVARWTAGRPLSRRFGAYYNSFVEEYVKNNTIVQYLL